MHATSLRATRAHARPLAIALLFALVATCLLMLLPAQAHAVPSGTISGIVSGIRLDGGTPEALPDIEVSLRSPMGAVLSTTTTDYLGRYEFMNLMNNGYYVYADPDAVNLATGKEYLPQWYFDAADFADAQQVIVDGPTVPDVIGIDFVLNAYPVIGGIITLPGGGFAEGVRVTATRVSDGVVVGETTTTASGAYRLTGFPAGTYTLYFDPSAINTALGTRYMGVFSNNVSRPSMAENIVLNQHFTSRGLQLAEADWTIYGAVQNPLGEGIADTLVTLVTGSGSVVATTLADANGAYEFPHLATGSYFLHADATDRNAVYKTSYPSQWYSGADSLATADAVAVDEIQPGAPVYFTLTPPDGSFHGTVYDGYGLAAPGVTVSLYSGYQLETQTVTSDLGHWGFVGLPGASYRVRFDPAALNEANDTDWMREWYSNTSSIYDATTTYLNGDKLLDYMLQRGGRLQGTIRSETGTALAGVSVRAESYGSMADADSRTTTTAADGTYSVRGLSYDGYSVAADPSVHNAAGPPFYITGAYDGFTRYWEWENSYTTVYVSNNTTETIDIALAEAAGITGRVHASDGSAAANVQVFAYEVNTESPMLVRGTTTDADGDYTIAPLYAGDYKLEFRPMVGVSDCIGEWYEDQATVESATVVATALGMTPTADATLTLGASVDGTVTAAADGAPLAGVGVSIYRQEGDVFLTAGWAITGADGHWSYPGLMPATYTVGFDCTDINASGGTFYPRLYYNNARTAATAEKLVLASGDRRSGISAVLADEWATVSGTVTDGLGNGIEGVFVAGFLKDADGNYQQQQPDAITLADGTFDFGKVQAGEWKFRFMGENNVTEYFDNVYSLAAATEVTLTPTSARTDINAVLSQPGSVSGILRDDVTGAVLEGIQVTIWPLPGVGSGGEFGSAITDAAGHYSIPVMAPGGYVMAFNDVYTTPEGETPAHRRYPTQYFDRALAENDAMPVDLVVDADRSRDASLVPGAIISGSVTSSGTAVPGAKVEVYRKVGADYYLENSWAPTYSAMDGTYEVDGLQAGTYRVQFTPLVGNYRTGYHLDADTLETAADVVVGTGATVTGIDGHLRGAGRIVGDIWLENAGFQPDAAYGAILYRKVGADWSQVAQSTADMLYFDFAHLDAGTYRVFVYGVDDAVGYEFYGDAPAPGTIVEYHWLNGVTVNMGPMSPWAKDIIVTEGGVNDLGTIQLNATEQLPVTTLVGATGWISHDYALDFAVTGVNPLGTTYSLGSGPFLPLRAGEPTPTITDEGATTLRYFTRGNTMVEATHTATIRIDKTPPRTLDDHLPAYAETAFIRMYGTDTLSGPDETRYSLDGGPETIGGAVVTTETGPHELTYWSTDKAGNVETPKTVTFSVGGDMTPPYTTAIAPVGWQRPPVNVELLAVDDSSGVAHTYYSTDGSLPTREYTGPIEITATGNHLVKYRSVDVAGNTEGLRFAAVWVDGTAPVTGSSLTTGSATATVTLTATDTVEGISGSGIASTSYRIDGGAEQIGRTVAVSGIGTHTVEFWSADRVGNAEVPKTETFRVGPATGPALVTRKDGATRYHVAANLARQGWKGAGAWTDVRDVIIANGEAGKEADPLAAAGLAGVYGTNGAPVLLVQARGVPAITREVLTEIAAAQPDVKIHVIGGTGSVPDAVVNSLKTIPQVNKSIERISGATRYDISVNIARKMLAEVPASDMPGVLIVNMENPAAFYDALAASPAAYSRHMPMLGVRATSVPSAVSSLLSTAFPGTKRYVVSSSTYVNASVQTQVGAETTRLTTSADRYTGAKEISTALLGKTWNTASDVGIASQLADALTGGAFLGKRGGVLLFTDTSTTLKTATSDFITAHMGEISNGWVIGGTGSVSAAAQTQFENLLK